MKKVFENAYTTIAVSEDGDQLPDALPSGTFVIMPRGNRDAFLTREDLEAAMNEIHAPKMCRGVPLDKLTTKALREWSEGCEKYPDRVVFVQIGDWVETYGDDAKNVHLAIGAALTKRQEVTMCAVPCHYVPKLEAVLKDTPYAIHG